MNAPSGSHTNTPLDAKSSSGGGQEVEEAESRKESNAFTFMMAEQKSRRAEHKVSSAGTDRLTMSTTSLGRDGLGAYTANPGAFPASRVIYYDKDYVALNDLYPKSSLHLLLLPRDVSKQRLHPFDAFDDPVFLLDVQRQVQSLRKLAAKELKRRHSTMKRLVEIEPTVSSGPPDGEEAVNEDIWGQSIISGIHAIPSMSHLHIHVLSTDRCSQFTRHKKHYNSFSTPFLIDVDDFPLAADDPRRLPGVQGYLNSELKCWRCKQNFGNKFADLKRHLDEEFILWKKACV